MLYVVIRADRRSCKYDILEKVVMKEILRNWPMLHEAVHHVFDNHKQVFMQYIANIVIWGLMDLTSLVHFMEIGTDQDRGRKNTSSNETL